ncbi:hypothetical protein ACVWZX_005265 [Deinococcus sp. UYEF24]
MDILHRLIYRVRAKLLPLPRLIVATSSTHAVDFDDFLRALGADL